MLLLYITSGRLLLNLRIMSHCGNHLSVFYDKIPVFYALKYPKFKIPSMRQRDDRTLNSDRLTAPSLLDHMRVLTIFSLT